MINEKHLVLTSHTKFLVLISNISGILLHKVLNQNERKKNEGNKRRRKGKEEEDRGKKEGGKEAQFQVVLYIRRSLIGGTCVQKNLITQRCAIYEFKYMSCTHQLVICHPVEQGHCS